MRRLWAYLIVVFTALVAVFASFTHVIGGVTTNGEFETRREFTFQLTERAKEDDDVDPKALDDNSAKDMAEIMKSRLEKYNVSSYDLRTSGNDTVYVSFSADSDSKYQQIVTYLCFSGSFALVNQNDDIVEGKDFLNGNAYTKSYAVNEYPTVIIPIKTENSDYQAVIQGAKDNPETKEATEEGAEAESVGRIYLLYNWQKGETYQTLKAANTLESKILMQIDFTPDEEEEGLYYDSNKNSFFRTCGFQDANGNGVADPNEVSAAYDLADYFVNLFSASALDYEVKCIRGLASGTEVWLDAKTEEVLSLEGKLVWNRTLTAVIAAIVILTLLLVFFYKMGAISTLTTALVSVFFAILVMVKSGLEYNVLGVVGLVLVAILSIISGVIYLNKIKEDCYKGHTIKKANTEASKKSLLPICDIHLVALVVGVMCYVLGGAALRSFGAILGIGSVISFVINTLGLKGLMWLLTNATFLNNRYDLLGINPENVPDHMAEEKQTFYGAYTEKSFSKHKKAVSIFACFAFLLSVAGMISAAALRGGDLFKNTGSSKLGSEIYIQNRIIANNDEKSPLDDNSLDTILDNILIQKTAGVDIDQSEVVAEGEKPTTYVVLADYISKRVIFATSESKIEEEIANNYVDTYFYLTLNKNLTGDETAEIRGVVGSTTTLSEVFGEYFDETSTFTPKSDKEFTTMSLKSVSTVANASSPKWDKIVLATAVAILIITVYLMLRYRLSRGLASIIFPTLASAVILGIMLLFNFFLTIPANVAIAVPVVTLFSYFFTIQFFNRERELLADEKVKDNSKEHRSEVAMRALGIAYTPILATAVLGIYCLINFFGFGPSNISVAYVAMFVGSIIALAFISCLVVPSCNLLFGWFSKVKINIRRPKKNKTGKPVHKSAEPEEAIFIGIND